MTSKEKTKSLVNKATTDDRNPPSGYLLKELASRTMSIAECQTIEDLIVKKLSKNKPYIKYKALRIVKYLCETGSPNWRRAWQRNTDKLRDAQQFRGPPDPIYGDAPYQQVRKAAKDAMQAVFQQSTIDSSHIKNRIKGMDGGTSAYSSSASTYTPSTFASGSSGVYGGRSQHKKEKAPSAPGTWGKQMPGHGNTSYQPSVRSTTFQPLKSSGGYSNPAVLSGGNTHSRGKLDTRGAGKRAKGKAGGIWGDDGDDDEPEEEEPDYSRSHEHDYTDDFPSSDRYSQPSSKKKLGSFGGNIKRGKNKSASSGQFEKKWVDDIVKSGGVGCRVLDLDKYVRQFENLSQNHVLEYLDEKLEDAAWQKQGKALALIEALLSGKSADDVLDYFSQSPDNIQALQSSKKSILRRKANAVIERLDLDDDDEEDDDEEDEQPVRRSTQQPQQQQPQSRDLLDMGGADEEEEEEDMFAEMQTKEDADQGNDLLNMGAPSQPQRQQQAPSRPTDDILDMMGDVSQVQSQAQQQAKKAQPYTDIFANLGGDSSAAQSNAQGNDVLAAFGGGGNNAQPQSQAQPQAQESQSAFGFDLGGGGGGGAQANQTQAQAQSNGQSTSAFGFDLGGGGNAQPAATQQQKPASGGSSAFGFDLGGGGGGSSSGQQASPMLTAQMMQRNMQNMANMQQMQQMMQQMQLNPSMMQQMGMNPQQAMMNMMQQQQMGQRAQMGQMAQQQPNLFHEAMNAVGGAQPQRAQQTYGHNDPFAQMMSGSAQPAPVAANRPKKAGPDPFADLALNSMQ